ncbi:flagellar biosynthesis protein FlgM [Pseudodesulfovibrio nedwellii]|uniref:Flagellar biosynthesis protein FlgM n=1 Tax=Pseudodesulfovibrio nedwellii TaxID=2973072 RepID=A0ABN6S4B7_9BACT|nr:LysE family translocator [Pseudodesulfovibrio nedwellii]BDQ36937.1 flagellar biosynthesis protein FlgM [Pseudodesulfovibrio nedwellii]
MINNYVVYVLLAITITAIPGPAVILTIRNSLKYGYKASIANILGNFIAMVLLATLSAVGLGALIISSSSLFVILKVFGCLYLIYLGIKSWKTPCIQKRNHQKEQQINNQKFTVLFKEGLGVGISNPKAIAFFTALFPQFVDPARTFIPQFLTLILTIEVISFIILTSYAISASLASPFLSKKRAMAIFNKLTGISFIGFGIALLCEDS